MKILIFFILFQSLSCGPWQANLDMKKPKSVKESVAEASKAFFPKSLGECASARDTCLVEGVLRELPKSVTLARLSFDSDVYKPIDYDFIREDDRRTLESAAIAQTINVVAKFSDLAKSHGIALNLVIDPLCKHTRAIKNGFYRKNYGTKDRTAKHFVCIGHSFVDKSGPIPLALDAGLIAHELFHILYSEFFITTDDLMLLSIENHDLESLNEGMADYLAIEVSGGLDPWFLASNNLNFRTPAGREELVSKEGHYGHKYKDGQRFTELALELKRQGIEPLPWLKCGLERLNQKYVDLAPKKDWQRVVGVESILDSFDECVSLEEKSVYRAARSKIFKEFELLDPVSEIDIGLVALTNKKAFCEFSRRNGVSASGFQKYQYIDACDGFSSLRYQSDALGLSPGELTDIPLIDRNLIWVSAGVRPTQGSEGMDCKLRGDTAIYNEVGLRVDGEGEKIPFSNLVSPNKQGSWYRDFGYGNLPNNFLIHNDFKPLEDLGFRFISYDPSKGLSDGINGLFLLPTLRIRGSTREERRAFLAEKLKATFSIFHTDSNGIPCEKGSKECHPKQNFILECRNHTEAVWNKHVTVDIFDCPEDDNQCEHYIY